MANLVSHVEQSLEPDRPDESIASAGTLIADLIREDAYVGDVYSLSYETALVQIHDYHREQVGGIPALSFLLATRTPPDATIDIRREEASVLLLRVLDHADLPNAAEALRVRVETAQRVSGEVDQHWDDQQVMDPTTHNILSYAGVRCRVLGTFYVTADSSTDPPIYSLSFGSDISNYYPNKGLKVYKPRAAVLQRIVNYRSLGTEEERMGAPVTIGRVRYASTHRPFQQVSDVPVSIMPSDLLGQKSALFGMTRTGKSNTTKIVLKAIFELRWQSNSVRIGQLVFDPNGEYANENTQDANDQAVPTAIKNVWACGPEDLQEELKQDVVTYGITGHPNDPGRHLMLLNFFEDDNLEIGKTIIDANLSGDRDAKYIGNFCDVRLEPPDSSDRSAMTRHNRRVLVYRALLYKAGFRPPANIRPATRNLFNAALLAALTANSDSAEYQNCATILARPQPSWGELI
ncbi:MAG: DUF87 domain-containing protein [Gemmatimonadota bacterium]|nr:DUF87 domain-containing protein [Gemmatimonadota bacterium]